MKQKENTQTEIQNKIDNDKPTSKKTNKGEEPIKTVTSREESMNATRNIRV